MFTKDREFYRSFIRLCLALMLEQAVVLSVNLADNLMLGTYSEPALAGVAAVNQIQFVYQQMVYAIGGGVVVLSSQYWGQRRLGEIRNIVCTGVRLEMVVAALLFVAASIFPEALVRLFSTNDAIVAQGVDYLRIIRFSYPVFALTALLLNAMRVVESVRIALVVSAISLAVNCAINYLLIGGNLGAPEMGVRGAAIGTLAARVVECAIVVAFVLRDQRLGLRMRDFFRKNSGLVKDFMRVTLPVLGSGLLWGVSNAMQTVILGHMDDSAIAAQSISNTVFLLLKVTAVGASSAASVLIGKTVGQGDMKRLKEYTRTLQCIFAGIGVLLAAAMLIIRTPLLGVYAPKISQATYDLASVYMLIQAGVLLVTSYQMPVNTGIIRGGGDPKFIMYMDMISICFFIPLAMLGGMAWGWSAIAVIVCVNIDQLIKCVPAAIRVNGYKWVHKLTRE